MPSRRDAITSLAGIGGLAALGASSAAAQDADSGDDPSELAVLWTSGDPDVAHRVGLMYTHAAKKNSWFETVRLIIWGPSQRTFAGDKDLQAKVADMRADGVIVEACVACATTFGLVERLREMDIPVKGMGLPLTQFLKDPNVAVLSV